MTGWFWAGLITGLAANECCAISEWTARKLVRWSAHVRYEDPERAEVRAQELEAVVADRPGQLFKLITAAFFVFSAVRVWIRRALSSMWVAEVNVWGAVALQATAALTAAFVAAASLTQLLDRPLQQYVATPSQNSVGVSQSLQAGERSVASLTLEVSIARQEANSAHVAWQCEVDGLKCSNASGRVGHGPLAAAKMAKFDLASNRVSSLEAQLDKVLEYVRKEKAKEYSQKEKRVFGKRLASFAGADGHRGAGGAAEMADVAHGRVDRLAQEAGLAIGSLDQDVDAPM